MSEPCSLRARLNVVLSSRDPRLRRLARASTSVRFLNIDQCAESVTLLLDREPPILVDGDEPAEITVELTDDQVRRFARGMLSLPSALLSGAAGHRGPVRKYMTVDPVLRGMLSEAETSDTEG